MGFDWNTIGMSTASQAAGGVMGLGLGMINDSRQLGQNKALLDQQIEANKQMGQFSNKLQQEMWDYTNYGNQVKHMKEAGLNPALLYGKGGGGGTSTGSGGMAVNSQNAPSGGGEAVAGMGIGLQGAQTMASIELQKAQARNLDADTQKKLGWEKGSIEADINYKNASTGNVKADTEIKELNGRIAGVAARIAESTEDITVDSIKQQYEQGKEELKKISRENKLGYDVYDTQVKQYKQNLANSIVDGELKKAQKKGILSEIDLNNQKIKNLIVEAVNSTDMVGVASQNATSQRIGAEASDKQAGVAKLKYELEKKINNLTANDASKRDMLMKLTTSLIGAFSNIAAAGAKTF